MESIKITISAIVPIYNTPELYLRACIESMQNQTLRESQIILVDDGSSEKCGNVCEEYAKKDSRITVIHKKNGGVSSARNEGLKYVEGHYLTFVDSDDTLEPETWEKSIAEMEIHNADCLVFGWKTEMNNVSMNHHVTESTKEIPSHEAISLIAGDNEACGGGYPWNKIWNMKEIRRTHDTSIPLFDTTLFTYEDKLWTLKMLGKTQKIILLPNLFYNYRYVESSLTNSDASWRKRQFNAYKAYDAICDYLIDKDRNAYKKALEKYFRFSFIDLRNMYPWRKKDLVWFNETKKAVLKVCQRIKWGELDGFKYNFAWIVCSFILKF